MVRFGAGDQRGAAVGGDRGQDRVVGVGGLVLEVEAGDERGSAARGVDRDRDMRRLQRLPAPVPPRLDRLEPVDALLVRAAAAEAAELRVDGRASACRRVVVLAVAFACQISTIASGDGRRAVQDAALDPDALAGGLAEERR